MKWVHLPELSVSREDATKHPRIPTLPRKGVAELNRICLVGRLAQDAELRYSQQGIAVTTMTIAVSHHGNDQAPNFIDVVVFRKLAESLGQYLLKGRLISVDGRLTVRKVDRDGLAHKTTEVVADRIRLLDRRMEGEMRECP